MKRISGVFLAFLILLATASTSAAAGRIDDSDVESALKTLDRELGNRNKYIRDRHLRIDSLKALASETDDVEVRLATLLEIGDSYNTFHADSAILIYCIGQIESAEAGLHTQAARFALRRATYLPLLLFFHESRRIIDSVKNAGVPPELHPELVDASRQMLFYTANSFTDFPELYDSIIAVQHQAQLELIDILPHDSSWRKLNLAESCLFQKDNETAMRILTDLLSSLDESDPLYARATHAMAEVCKAYGDSDGQSYYLALSAISDLRCATLEVTSLQELGKKLYDQDDIERAYTYLSTALSNAVDCRASLRIIQTSQSIPLIETAHRLEIRKSDLRIYFVMAGMAILLIVLAVTVSLVKRRNSQLGEMTVNLAEANSTKDVYITQFLNLCSIYMDKLNQFNKIVNRKLTTGKGDELLKLTKSAKFVEEQSREFYEVFDDAFLHLYPDFVEKINELLEPDKQVELRPDEKLNTDLRIMALMRLGIDDSSRIAQMLNYSVYTIYTYRNKFKSRAKNRETLEADIMAISSATPYQGIVK